MLINPEILQNQLLSNSTVGISTGSCKETVMVGREFGMELSGCTPAVVFLYGDLGAGKTYFTKGIARSLGIEADDVCSPTFILVREHHSPEADLFHCDLYRIRDDIQEIQYLDLFEDVSERSVHVIEWPPVIQPENISGLKDIFESIFSVCIERTSESTRRICFEKLD